MILIFVLGSFPIQFLVFVVFVGVLFFLWVVVLLFSFLVFVLFVVVGRRFVWGCSLGLCLILVCMFFVLGLCFGCCLELVLVFLFFEVLGFGGGF